ncbi:MAG: metallophosphoesterase [Thaumarchaeota archaeon]|nr:metallophosphoesterase [Nitrososphaerota archaeon]
MVKKSSTSLIKLQKGLSIVSPWPAVYIEKESTLVVADLHLGLEDELQSKGLYLPSSTFPTILENIISPVIDLACKRIILLGDIKHEFGRPKEAEWWGVRRLIKKLKELKCEPAIVRGNHDNYIIYISKELGAITYDRSVTLDDFLLFHGHLPLNLEEAKASHIIMGHEHPSIQIRDSLGVKHRYKAFLHGKIGNKIFTILPSVSPLTIGSDVNIIPSSELLSPLLRGENLDKVTPYALDIGSAVQKFPNLGRLRGI